MWYVSCPNLKNGCVYHYKYVLLTFLCAFPKGSNDHISELFFVVVKWKYTLIGALEPLNWF